MLDPSGTARQIPVAQKDAALKAGGRIASKMIDPKGTARWIPQAQEQEALAAGGKMAEAPHAKTPNASSSPSSNALVTPEGGIYEMHQKDGKPVPVSYSNVLKAMHDGYFFADRHDLSKYATDHAADPKNHTFDKSASAKIEKMSYLNPLRYVAQIGLNDVNILHGAGKEVAKVATAFDRPPNSWLEQQAQLLAATPLQGVAQHVGAVGEQVGELSLAPESKVTELKALEDLPTISRSIIGTVEHGARGAVEQGAQTYVHSRGNKEEAKGSAELGGVAGAAAPIVRTALPYLGEFANEVEKFFDGTSDIQTGQIVEKERLANKEIAEKADMIRRGNEEKIRQNDGDHEKKLKAAQEAYEEKLKIAKEPAEKAQLKNEHNATQAQIDHEHAIEKSRIEHEQSIIARQKLEAEDAVARRKLLLTRSRLRTRLHAINDAAQAYFKKNYADIEKVVGERTLPGSTLADAVTKAQDKLEGSAESIKAFRDILSKYPIAEPPFIEYQGAQIPKGHPLYDVIQKETSTEKDVPVTFSNLKGYYSELGRMLSSPSVPGDVKQAVSALRNSVDEMQQKLADEAGVGQKYKLLRNQYRNYAQGFKDYQGPNQSGSPVAYALQAADPYNATKPFLGQEPEEISRIKQILVGKPTDASTQFIEGNILTPSGKPEPAWRYRRDTVKLLDNFLEANRNAEGIEKQVKSAKPIGEFVPPEPKVAKTVPVPEPKPVPPFKPPEKKPPILADVPRKQVMTPEKLEDMKRKALRNARASMGRFGIYMATGGLIGGVIGMLRGRSPAEVGWDIAGGLAVGLGGGQIAPYVIARLSERPAVVKSLTKITRRDLLRLAELPSDERAGVEEAVKMLADEEIRKGRLRADQIPWLRIIGGTTAKTLAAPAQTTVSDKDAEKELEQIGAP